MKTTKEAIKKAMLGKTKPTITAKNMSIGALGNPDIVFSRKFRWTLAGTTLPEHFARTVKFDFTQKRIYLSYYDVASQEEGSFHALVWADKIENWNASSETLVFTTYDGCGVPLYTMTFKGLFLVGHTSDFDYASSEEATQELTIKYNACDKKILCNSKNNPFDNYQWQVQFQDEEGKVLLSANRCRVRERPSFDIEETEVNHLNAKIFMPGKASWRRVVIQTSKETMTRLLPFAYEKKNTTFTAILSMTANGKEIETWRLANAWLQRCVVVDDECELVLAYHGAQYNCAAPAREKHGN